MVDEREVSVVVPCMNEARHVETLIQAIAAQVPKPREIIFVDGGSTDDTVGIIRRAAERVPDLQIQVIVDPDAWLPQAINQAVLSAAGRVIIRFDAHASPAPGYVARALEHLADPHVGVAGGVWRIVPGAATSGAAAIARAVCHPLGAADAAYRLRADGARPEQVDTVPFGCFTRDTWSRVGRLNESLLGNEDYEFNYRVRQAGLQVRLDPSMQSTYVARATIRALALQYFRYGWCKMQMLSIHPTAWRWRQFVPLAFVLGVFAGALAAVVSPMAAITLAAVLSVYVATLAAASLAIALRARTPSLLPRLMLAFATIHFCWGSGALVHILALGRWPGRRFLFGRPKIRAHDQRLILQSGDALVAAVAILVALWVWSVTTGFPFGMSFLTERWVWLLAAPAWLVVIAPTRGWRVAQSLPLTVRGLASACGVLLAIYAILYFYLPPLAVARLPGVYFVWEAVLLTIGWRLVYLYLLDRGGLTRRAVIIGSGARADAARSLLVGQARDTEVVAVLADREGTAASSAGRLAELETFAAHGIAEVVLAMDGPPSAELTQRLLRLQEADIDVVPFTAEYERRLQRLPIAYLDADWAFTSLPEWVRSRDASRSAKRAVDVAGALVGLAVLLVLLVPIAAGILITGGRPVFYRQRRLGQGGRIFEVIKFRTMAADAEADGAKWAAPDDPRTTLVGRWLRRSRLDELPQVWNVLRGEMSLVGPRPERPEFAERLEELPFYRTRLMVQPGLTGWAQVNAEYGDSIEGQALKLEHDLYYIKHRSLLFDLWILIRTIGPVLGLRGR